MRRFTLLIALLLSLAGVTQAQSAYDGIYTLGVDENLKRGYVAAGEGYPDYPVLSEISWDAYAGNSTTAVENGKYWYITTTNDGTSYYIYNVAVGKFLVGTGTQINFGDTPYLWKISAYNETYLNIEDASNAGKYLSGGCGRTAAQRPMAYDTNKDDGGARYTLNEFTEGDFSTQKDEADKKIADYEAWLETKDQWTETTAPTLSTDEAPVYYSIKNLRRSKYAAYEALGAALKQTNADTDAGAVWYLEDASAAAGEVGEGVIPVYIKNAATKQALTSAISMGYAETGTIFYLIPHTNTYEGYVISTSSTLTETRDSWCDENGAGRRVCYYMGDDSGSIWAFVPTAPSVVSTAAAGEAALFAADLAAAVAKAEVVCQAWEALEFFKPEAAIADYKASVAAVGQTEVTTYAELAAALATLSEAQATFEAAVAADDVVLTNAEIADGTMLRFLNKQSPTFYMTTDANGVDAYAPTEETNYVSSTLWKAVGNSTEGYKLYNPLKGGYIVHPTGNGVQATLVTDAAQASVYDIVPNGLYVNITLKEAGEEARPALHYGTEEHVTKYTVDNDRSLWGISSATEADQSTLEEDIKAYVQTTIAAAKADALLKANAADDFAYYACTAENVATAVTALEAVSTDITTHAQLTAELAKVDAAITALYTSQRTAGPADGDLIRFTNKKYADNYLGYDEAGLAHYVPAATEDEGALASTTIWTLEAVEGDETGTKFYLKNDLLGLYTEHQYNAGSQVLFARTQAASHPVTITLVENQYNERGELCFVIETTEEVSGQAIHAAASGIAVNGSPEDEASMWAITRATDEDLEAINLSTQLQALVNFLLQPTIEAAQRYYYEADGEVTNDFIDDVRAGYYTYVGENADDTWETAKANYVSDIDKCIQIAANTGGSNKDQVLAAVSQLEAWMAKFELNKPNMDGFFRLRCVYNDQYLQSDLQGSRLALNQSTGTASIFYFDANDAVDGGGRLLSYDQGLFITQGKTSAIYAGLQPIGTNGDAFSFTIPANHTFGSYNISSASGNGKRYLYGNAYTTTQDGEETKKLYYADNGADATVATQGDTNNNGYNWLMERLEEIPVAINAYGFATFYAPVALDLPETGVHAYVAGSLNDKGDELSMNELTGTIPAGTAVLLQVDEGLEGTTIYLKDNLSYQSEAVSTSDGNGPQLRGTAPKVNRGNNPSPELNQAENGKIYTFQMVNDVKGFHPYTGTIFNHFRAFLELPNNASGTALKLKFNDETTSIEEVFSTNQVPQTVYDLSGRRVTNPGKGVYIVNGKKVYLK